MGRAILSSLLLAAALVACAAQNPGTLNNCPNATTLQFFDAAPSQFPATIDCTTTTQYAVYQYWSPPLTGGDWTTSTNPTNPSVSISTISSTTFLADGSVAPGVGTTAQFGPSPNVGVGSPPTAPQITPTGERSCGAFSRTPPLGLALTWSLQPYVTTWQDGALTPINTRALCCQQCSADPNCRSWRFIPQTSIPITVNGSTINANSLNVCSLYSVYSNGTGVAVVDATDYGVSAGYGTLAITLGPTLPPNLASVTTTFGVAYNQICAASAGLARAVNGTDTITFTPIANAPTASVANAAALGVCVNATTINGSFVYSGSFTSGNTNFTVLVDGATCLPGASPISGNQTSATVLFSCTGLSPLAVGTHNISVSASYGGVGGARCTGGTTAATTGNFNVQAAPTAALAASSAAAVCTGSQNIIATFTYAAGAVATSTFAATIAPYVGATCTPVQVAGTPNDTVTVTCTAPFPGFPVGTQTVTLTATYTGVAPCSTVTQTVSANATATVAAAGSGIALTPIATSSVCSPVDNVGAAWTYTATNIGNTNFVATSPGLSCVANPASATGSTGAITPVNVTVVCSNAGGPVAAGSVPVTLTATYAGNAPCPGGALNGTSSVTVLPQPTGSLAPRAVDNPVRTCFGSKAFDAIFDATLTGTATSWDATSATLAGLFPCNFTQTGSTSGSSVTAICTRDAGYPSGTWNLTVTGTFAAAAPCSGGSLSGGITTVIVAPEPTVTVTPRTPVAGCNGAANVSVDFDYTVTGAGTSPDLSLTVPTGCTAPVPSSGTSGTIRVTCTGPFTADVPVSLTIGATEQPAGLCGSGSGSGATVVPILCCSPPGTTSYAKLNNGDYNDPVCRRHQKPGNSQFSPCGPAQFAFGWMNQGQTSDTTPSTFEAMSNTQDPTCPSFGAIGTVTARCTTLDGITGVGANGRAGNILRIAVSNYAASTVPTMRVYAMCQPPRNNTCYASSGSLWRNPFTWPRYRPVTTSNVTSPSGDLKTTTFNIPMATYFSAPSGGCTCDTIFWFVEQVGTYRFRPAAGATCPWTLQ